MDSSIAIAIFVAVVLAVIGGMVLACMLSWWLTFKFIFPAPCKNFPEHNYGFWQKVLLYFCFHTAVLFLAGTVVFLLQLLATFKEIYWDSAFSYRAIQGISGLMTVGFGIYRYNNPPVCEKCKEVIS